MLKVRRIKELLVADAAPGVFLVIAAILALIISNSPWQEKYTTFFRAAIGFKYHDISLSKPLLLWINDGLMAIFFFLIGLEVKREVLIGNLSSIRRMIVPVIGATGGVILPAVIFYCLNKNDPVALRGWAIPTATDVAFALGLLVLLGSHAPQPIRVLLGAIAILDDILAILIIAVFYSNSLTYFPMTLALGCLIIAITMNAIGIASIIPYILVGAIMWLCILASGVHATLTGVIMGFTIPLRLPQIKYSPLKYLEKKISPWSAYVILPLFAFANSGISLERISLSQMFHMVPLGIALGLFFGKQIGVFSFIWFGIRCKIAQIPPHVTTRHLYAMSIMCGIGFTMSLFIGSLAYNSASSYAVLHRIGILIGSLLSAISGYLFFKYFVAKEE